VIQHHPRGILRPVGETDYGSGVHDQVQQLTHYLCQWEIQLFHARIAARLVLV
jgi:hypothetical protein